MNENDALYLLKLLGGYITSEEPFTVAGLDEAGREIYDLFIEDQVVPKPTPDEIRTRIRAILEEAAPNSTFTHDEDSPNEMFVIWSGWEERNSFEKLYKLRYGEPDENIMESGFYDEYDLCSNCAALVRTAPDCYAWQPDFYIFEDSNMLCLECIREYALEEYVEDHVNANKLLNDYIVCPSKFGWEMVEGVKFENGFHHGQNHDPGKIIRTLNDADIDCIFTGSVGQFDVNWNVWVKDGNQDRAYDAILGNDVTLGYDQATEMSKALRGEPSDHIQVVHRKLTKEEFISGDWAREEAEDR